MRKLIIISVVALLLLVVTSLSFANTPDIALYLNGKKMSFNAAPQLNNERVYVPLRELFEQLDATVHWDDATRTVTATSDGTRVQITIDNKTAKHNDTYIILEAAPYISNKRAYVPLRFVSEAFGAIVNWEESTDTVSIVTTNQLPVVGSYDNLKELLKESSNAGTNYYAGMDMVIRDSAMKPMEQTEQKTASASPEYSETNLQVQGVDEADIIKTDGEYLYQITNQEIVISKIYPADDMEVVKSIPYGQDEKNSDFSPLELYIDDNFLVVIGSTYYGFTGPDMKEAAESVETKIYPPLDFNSGVKVIVYDRIDKENPRMIKAVEIEGSYLSSRKIDSSLYLVSNKFPGYHIMSTEADYVPALRYRDNEEEYSVIPYSDIHYFPEAVSPNYLTVMGVNLDKPDEKANISTYLGAGENIYASSEHLYIALTEYEAIKEPVDDPPVTIQEQQKMIAPAMPVQGHQNTAIHKFALVDGDIAYRGKGSVPGSILNQFSMDEHKGYFRIATTIGNLFGQGDNQSKNNVYILDAELKTVGKIEDIAPGEKIYSARFMGDRGYLVTFKKVDPLFVFDLKDPEHPEILGKLKIPGYSDYLHPFGENYIIGFGKDTIEVGDEQFGDGISRAFYQGMKIALFDVTDVTNPIELHKEIIGDRGTDSELLKNHKSLLFDEQRNLLAFPVTVMEIKEPLQNTTGWPQYGEFSFQGAYVYNLDTEHGFNLKGRITHLTNDDFQKTGYYHNNTRSIKRILYVGDNLYTVSDGMIKANQLNNLKEIDSLKL